MTRYADDKHRWHPFSDRYELSRGWPFICEDDLHPYSYGDGLVWVISYSWSEWLNPYYDRHELGSGVTCLLTGWVKDFPCRRILDWGVTCLLAGREKSFLLWITMCKYSNSNLPLAEHVPPNRLLFGGTVPPTRKLFGGTVPLYSKLFGRTVPPNSFPLQG